MPDHPACNPYDTAAGHYWGNYTPIFAGSVFVSIFFRDPIFNVSYPFIEDGFITADEFKNKAATKVRRETDYFDNL